MTFDPFGDYGTRGYLRNRLGEKDLAIVRRVEHSSFVTGLAQAFSELNRAKEIAYEHVLATHKTLFDAVYPWAGQDRLAVFPDHAVTKGDVRFADPMDIRRAVDHALRTGHDKAFMANKPGEVMGYLAFGHPFLDGNGRTIMVVHAMLSQRAGFSIDWAKTSKADYLAALTKEIAAPGKGHLDAYLKSLKGAAIAYEKLASAVESAPGLDGNAETNTVLGKTSEPGVKADYEQLLLKRDQS